MIEKILEKNSLQFIQSYVNNNNNLKWVGWVTKIKKKVRSTLNND